MPFYEYLCKSCGRELEAMQKVSDTPLKKCPHCGKSQLQRLMSAPVFRLKGSGWYETDFKDDKDKKRNLVESSEAEAPKDAKTNADAKVDAAATAAEPISAKDKPADKPAEKKVDSIDKPTKKSSHAAKRKRTVGKAAQRSKRR